MLTLPKKFRAAFSGFQRKNKILWRQHNANSSQDVIVNYRMDLLSLAGSSCQTQTNIFRAFDWSDGCAVWSCDQGIAFHSTYENMDNLFQGNTKGSFFLDETGQAVACLTYVPTGRQRTDSCYRRFYNTKVILKSTFCWVAPRPRQTYEQTSLPLGPNPRQFGHDWQLRQQTYCLSPIDALNSKRGQSYKITFSFATNASSHEVGATENPNKASSGLLVYERSFPITYNRSGEMYHRSSQKGHGPFFFTPKTSEEETRTSTQIRTSVVFRNHPKRMRSTGGQATSLRQEKTVSILQLQGQSKIPKRPSMQNCLVSIPARFRQMDKMAFTDLHHAASSSHRNYPALCFKMVDRTNVQRTQKPLRTPRGVATNKTSIGQMDNVPLIGLQSTKTPCVNPWSGRRGKSFSHTLEEKQANDSRVDGYRHETTFSWVINSASLGPEITKNAGARSEHNTNFRVTRLKNSLTLDQYDQDRLFKCAAMEKYALITKISKSVDSKL